MAMHSELTGVNRPKYKVAPEELFEKALSFNEEEGGKAPAIKVNNDYLFSVFSNLADFDIFVAVVDEDDEIDLKVWQLKRLKEGLRMFRTDLEFRVNQRAKESVQLQLSLDAVEDDILDAEAVVDELKARRDAIRGELEQLMAPKENQLSNEEKESLVNDLRKNTNRCPNSVDWDELRLAMDESPECYEKLKRMIDSGLEPVALARFEKLNGMSLPGKHWFSIGSMNKASKMTQHKATQKASEMGLSVINKVEYEAAAPYLIQESELQDTWTGDEQVSFINRQANVSMGLLDNIPNPEAAARFCFRVDTVDRDELMDLLRVATKIRRPSGCQIRWEDLQNSIDQNPRMYYEIETLLKDNNGQVYVDKTWKQHDGAPKNREQFEYRFFAHGMRQGQDEPLLTVDEVKKEREL